MNSPLGISICLRHIINYKVLKPSCPLSDHSSRLRHIINYKVLKPSFGSLSSQAPFKTYHKLQGSQTLCFIGQILKPFKTYHKLQGSQTEYEHLINLASLRHIINYKVLKQCLHSHFIHPGLRHIINYKVLKP